jgi:Cu-Zn family superoxide dismutase
MTGKLRSRRVLSAVLAVAAGVAAIWAPLRAQPRGRGGRGLGSGGRQETEASALAVLQAAPGEPKVEGSVLFYSRGGKVQLVADVSGLDKPGLYALHVQENLECKADPAGKQHFASAGGDLNPAGTPHGCPDAPKHHAGDLGNMEVAADGTGHLELTTGALSMSGASSLIGKAVVLYGGSDDCVTQPDGNAGPRLACGVAESVDTSQGRQPRRRGGRGPGGTGTGPPV